MKKKIIALIIGIIVVIGMCITIYFLMNNNTKVANDNQSKSSNERVISNIK